MRINPMKIVDLVKEDVALTLRMPVEGVVMK